MFQKTEECTKIDRITSANLNLIKVGRLMAAKQNRIRCGSLRQRAPQQSLQSIEKLQLLNELNQIHE